MGLLPTCRTDTQGYSIGRADAFLTVDHDKNIASLLTVKVRLQDPPQRVASPENV
jgi:hypothetical protein